MEVHTFSSVEVLIRASRGPDEKPSKKGESLEEVQLIGVVLPDMQRVLQLCAHQFLKNQHNSAVKLFLLAI